MTLTQERLDEIRKRAEASTTGKWRVLSYSFGDTIVQERGGLVLAERVDPKESHFIAHAREDVPALLAEVERLKKSQEEALTNYIELFIDYIDCLDEISPDWREYMADTISDLREALQRAETLQR